MPTLDPTTLNGMTAAGLAAIVVMFSFLLVRDFRRGNVTADAYASLKEDLVSLKTDMTEDLADLKTDMTATLQKDFVLLRTDLAREVGRMESQAATVHNEIGRMRDRLHELSNHVGVVGGKQDLLMRVWERQYPKDP
jgi:hypothetical protein